MPANPHGGVFPPGLATGIGSLPFADAAEAAELVLRVHPDLPSVPQLASPREGVVAQWAGALPEITVAPDGSLAARPRADRRAGRRRRSPPTRTRACSGSSTRPPRTRPRSRASRRRSSVR